MRIIDVIKEGNISTNYNPKYSIVRLTPIHEYEYDNGFVENIPDMLNWKLAVLLKAIQNWAPYEYDGTKPITTIAYETYGTTTVWWIILMYNGFMHPLEMQPGIVIKIPARADVDKFLLSLDKRMNEIGKRVKI